MRLSGPNRRKQGRKSYTEISIETKYNIDGVAESRQSTRMVQSRKQYDRKVMDEVLGELHCELVKQEFQM